MCKKKNVKERLRNKCAGKARHGEEMNEKERDAKGKEINVKRM